MKNNSSKLRTQAALVVGSIMSNIKNPLFLSTFQEAFSDMLNLTVEIIKTNERGESLKMISNLSDLSHS